MNLQLPTNNIKSFIKLIVLGVLLIWEIQLIKAEYIPPPPPSVWRFSELCANPTNRNPEGDSMCSRRPTDIWCGGTCVSYCPNFKEGAYYGEGTYYGLIRIPQDMVLEKLVIPYHFADSTLPVKFSVKYGSFVYTRHVDASDPVFPGNSNYRIVTLPQPLQLRAGTTLGFWVVDFDTGRGDNGKFGALGFKFPYQDENGRLICGEVGVSQTGECGGTPGGCCSPPPDDRCWCYTPVRGYVIDGFISTIQNQLGKDVLFPLCYADTPIRYADFDFEDYEVFLIGQGGLSCKCTETTCEVTPGNPKTACREKYDPTYEDSCTYTCCDSPNDCTPEECTKTVKGSYLSTRPTCSWDLPDKIRFSGSYSGSYFASAYDRGDRFQTTAVQVDKGCLKLYKGTQDFTSLVPITYRAMVCDNAGYSRPRDYRTDLTLVPQGGDRTQDFDEGNICKVRIDAEVAAEGPVGELLTNTCSKDIEVFYPPVLPLDLGFIDKNKSSAQDTDGKEPSKMVERYPVERIGGIGEDPYQLVQSTIDDILSSGVCTATKEINEFEYRRGDANPFDIWLDLWDENGPSDFNVWEQEVFLVNKTSKQKYPVNRDASAEVSANVLGLVDLGSAMQELNTGSTNGFATYPVSGGDIVSAFGVCIADSKNEYCANRYAVEDVSSVRIRNLLSLIDSNDLRYKYIDGMPAGIRNNPPLGKRIWLRVYQRSLPNGEYFVSVATKDKEGAKMEFEFADKTFVVDNTVPNVSMKMTICGVSPEACREGNKQFGGDVLKFTIDITDESPIGNSLEDYPFFGVFVAVKNADPDLGNRFLRLWDYRVGQLTQHVADGRLFGTKYPSNVDVSSLFKVLTNNGKHKKYEFYVAGVRGGDEVHFGVCAYDRFGNIKCSWGDSCSGGDVSTQGRNWLKTSLNNVYSRGGFTDLPDYFEINNVYDWPIRGKNDKIKDFFTNYLSPFLAPKATLSTFSVVLDNPGTIGLIRWGYEWNKDEYYNVAAFKNPLRIIEPTSGIYDALASLAKRRCSLLEACNIYNVTNSNNSSLPTVLKGASRYKLVFVNVDGDLDLYNQELICRNANLIFVEKGNIRLSKIRKASFNPASGSPFKAYKDGCLFIFAPNASAKIVIDDNPNEQSTIKGEVLTTRNDPYGVDADFIQMGIIALDPNASWDNPQVWVKQTPRDNYRHSGGYFDALIWHGFVYSLSVPRFERDLSFGANAKFPSEWIIYDPGLMLLFDPLLGKYKVQTIKCGVNRHPWCNY